jgi:hypothetical protein
MIISSFRSNLELKPVGTLDVKLVQAKNLLNKDLIGKSDPFAVVFVRPLRDKTKTSKTIVRYLFIYLLFIYLSLCVVHIVIQLVDMYRITN